jgi:hypothetical protein
MGSQSTIFFARARLTDRNVDGAAQTASVTVDAIAPNCDIEVDGTAHPKSRGNTPSTLNLTAGKHDIVVKKIGYDDWTRSMTVGSGSVHLNAEMVAK